jgi:hypothetical protein
MTLIPDLQRDLVDAAARLNGRRRRLRLWLRLTPAVLVAAALIGATVLLLGGGGSDSAPSSREPAGSPQNSSPSTPPEQPPWRPPRRGPQPMPGSLSQAVRFEFAGVGYSIVGFRARSGSRDGVICTRLVARGGGRSRRLVGATCAGEGLLHRELDDHPARTVGTGGQPAQISGFARADVARIAVLDSQYHSRVVLSEPWSPEPWQGQPIRFFLVLIDAPPDRARDFLLQDRPRLEARLTSGELVEVVP